MAYVLDQLLRESAGARPDATALVDGTRCLRYGDLDDLADRLAATLRGLGVSPMDTVAVHLPKSVEAVAALYGVMRARAAYVPMDPLAPAARIATLIRDCRASAVITSSAGWSALAPELSDPPPLIVVGDQRPQGALGWRDVLRADPAPTPGGSESDLAYVLYTSGSTGRPKGVMITHRAALTFVDWCVRTFEPRPDDRFSSHAPFHFDLSIHDLYVAAACGASVHLLPAEEAYFPAAVDAFVRREDITIWYSVPTALVRLARFLEDSAATAPYPSLRLILFAGEVFPMKELRLLRRLLPRPRLFNLYGPTETNVCTYYEVRGPELDSASTLPIGRACENTEVFAVTESGALARPGEEGELWARGPGLMSGYLDLPVDTAARLQQHPFTRHLPERAYRTGDIVRLRDDGDLDFLGRRDHQVKLRGYRVELGEVEATLVTHPAVLEAAVLVAGEQGEERLEAFVRSREGSDASPMECLAWCQARLPAYMAPARVHVRRELPLTSTGKVDRQALRAEMVVSEGLAPDRHDAR